MKPPNIVWVPSERQVYLVDFGHAQLIEGARGYRATKEFELGNEHTLASDAYTVGKTLQAELIRLGIGPNHWLAIPDHS